MTNDEQMPDVRRWDYYPIEMPLTADGKGPATVGVDAARIAYEVWDRDLLSHASYDNLPDAINEAMRLNAALPSDPAADLCASGQQVRALELRLRDWQGRAEMAGRALEAVLSGKPVRNADEIVSFCKTAALTPAPQPEGSDNPSGMTCTACRGVGAWHCSDPEHCGGMKPMRSACTCDEPWCKACALAAGLVVAANDAEGGEA